MGSEKMKEKASKERQELLRKYLLAHPDKAFLLKELPFDYSGCHKNAMRYDLSSLAMKGEAYKSFLEKQRRKQAWSANKESLYDVSPAGPATPINTNTYRHELKRLGGKSVYVTLARSVSLVEVCDDV